MRLYAASDEEQLRSRRLLKEWTGEGLLSAEQHALMEPQTVCELRTTNIFLRVVLFFFTIIIVAAATGLFFVGSRPSEQSMGILFLFFAAVCYGCAEVAASQFHLYRHGIEEALAVCSVAFLCVGLGILAPHERFLLPAAGVVSSLWIWYRFGFWYSFLAAMVFTVFLPDVWNPSHSAQRVVVAALYAVGLVCVAAIRLRHRFDYLNGAYSVVEAMLWLGIYIDVNLKITSVNYSRMWSGPDALETRYFGSTFYWITWVLIWCIPPVILARGVREKDRFVLAAGAIATLLTFVTNKPYLGWQRHTWDPMLLGIVLLAAALFLRRWLARGTDGVRRGFTSARLSGRDDRWRNAVALSGLVTPQMITPGPQTGSTDGPSTGGASGGGGASREF